MKHRKTSDKKNSTIIFKVTEEEHKLIKSIATNRSLTMTRFILEAIRTYIREKT